MYHKLDDAGNLWIYPDESDCADGQQYPASEDDVREYLYDAGFTNVAPEDIGALTSGDIFTDEGPDDDGKYPPDAAYYWHEAYAVEDMAEAIREHGGVKLQRG